MTLDEAKELLSLHAFTHPDAAEHPKAESGFLGALRPYRGLSEANFREVMLALRVLGPSLAEDRLDREVVAALWGICHFGRAWGVHPEGMLRRNGHIADADVVRLEQWLEAISYATACLLDGAGEDVAFETYDRTPP